ncbi:aspartate-semialdehyde dehydrogenase [Streptomyces virginiae]|uniref:aspartate-semialdehyde dehydrogenase n=1 Tax=Streptomyces TaxID=1883 RepID=UPI001370CDE0|nr:MULTISPECIES: aspartate-semialdehyde dehydrogenase [Streptomyces]MCX5272831.1 aspartate-semialdehyde dehydrogenase [Streptomyces virginiae]MYV78797.1 aspartate-semialdehyde dehydrogenase [Streptomyces sp. SID1046]
MPQVDDPAAPRIAVVGATGAVGGTLLELIEDRALPYRRLHLVASARSAGRTIRVDGRDHRVTEVPRFAFDTVDVALFCAGEQVSREWVPVAVAHGALAVDSTAAFRMTPGTPLVVPQLDAAELGRRPVGGVIAMPGAATVPVVRVLRDVERRWGIRRVVVSTYQGASGAGHGGIEELQDGSRTVLQDPQATVPSTQFSPPLAFNVLPGIGEVLADGSTRQEREMADEVRKVLGLPGIEVTATCVRVPMVSGQGAAVWTQCRSAVDRTELVALLRALPEVVVHDPGGPTPAALDDPDRLHVGRIRVSTTAPDGFWVWLATDNLRVGGALDAVRIVEELLARGAV